MPLSCLPVKYLKKYAANIFTEKTEFAALCSQRVFQRALFTKSLGTFEKWTFIFLSIFGERCHFFSGLL